MGQLTIDRRSWSIDDSLLITLQTALLQLLPSQHQIRLVVHGADGEDHVVVAGMRPFTIHTDTVIAASPENVERLREELDLLGRIALVGGRT